VGKITEDVAQSSRLGQARKI
jgi:hypothetical protein